MKKDVEKLISILEFFGVECTRSSTFVDAGRYVLVPNRIGEIENIIDTKTDEVFTTNLEKE